MTFLRQRVARPGLNSHRSEYQVREPPDAAAKESTRADTRWRLGHRPELDGLRGVAIALVVAFHLAPNSIPGAKFGVDLFFVLSGFLITFLLIEEAAESGRIAIRAFYGRRARRLLPALFSVVLVVGVVFLFRRSWVQLRTIVFVLGYVANYAWMHHQLAGPLQHCWSFAVEEQFYIVWPILFAVLLKFRWRGWTTAAIGGLALLIVAHRVAGNGPGQSDLGTDVRADALLVGCLLACGFAWFNAAAVRWWRPALFATPLLALQAIYSFDLRGLGFSVVAVLFAYILAAAITCAPLGRCLSWRPLCSLGVISYSLYLWHYPVIYWIRGSKPDGIYDSTLTSAALALAFSLVLAWASYVLVERRFVRPREATSRQHVSVN